MRSELEPGGQRALLRGLDGELARRHAAAIESSDALANRGAADLFDATTGQKLFRLMASDAGSSDRFGTSVLTGARLERNNWGLFLQGNLERLPGVPMGAHPNGLLQLHGNLQRLGLVQADARGFVDSSGYLAMYGQTISSWGGVAPGDTRSYQLWSRTPNPGAPCTPGNPGGSNTTNGYTLSWLP